LISNKEPFDPKAFLADVGERRTIAQYGKNQEISSQGAVADSGFTFKRARSRASDSLTTQFCWLDFCCLRRRALGGPPRTPPEAQLISSSSPEVGLISVAPDVSAISRAEVMKMLPMIGTYAVQGVRQMARRSG
jgi:hypothetical protein